MLPRSQQAADAVRRGHKRATTVTLRRPRSASGVVLPFREGSVSWSLSKGDGVRSGTLTVPGYEWFALVEPGQYGWVEIEVGIEGEVWDLGQWPITRAVADRPKGTVTLTLGDWAWRAAKDRAQLALTVGGAGATVASVVSEVLTRSAPLDPEIESVTVIRDDSGGALCASPVEVPLGGSMWAALTTVVNQVGCVVVVTGRTTCEIRNFRAGAEVDSVDGAIISETVGVVADEAVNRVIVVGETSAPDKMTFRADRTLAYGPYAYDQERIGKLALVETLRQPVVTQELVDAEADRIFARRAGVVRSSALDVVPMPWLQVGDTVGWGSTFVPDRMTGLINDLTLPLTAAGSMRVTLRDAAVTG